MVDLGKALYRTAPRFAAKARGMRFARFTGRSGSLLMGFIYLPKQAPFSRFIGQPSPPPPRADAAIPAASSIPDIVQSGCSVNCLVKYISPLLIPALDFVEFIVGIERESCAISVSVYCECKGRDGT